MSHDIFSNNNDSSIFILNFHKSSPESLEAKLRAMQTKLSQIALIPILIQSTLGDAIENVTSTTADAGEITCIEHATSSSSSSTIVAEHIETGAIVEETISQTATVETTVTSEENTAENASAEQAIETTSIDNDNENNNQCDEVCFSPPTSPERDLESQPKNEQQLKMREMEKSWPWKDEEKKVQK